MAAARFGELYRHAFVEAAGRGSARDGAVVWAAGDSELLVRMSRVRVVLAPGLVVVAIPVSCRQTGSTEVTVAFAVGSPHAEAGLVVAAEDAPRGPAVVVGRWGDALTAAAYDALLSVAEAVAGAAGTDLHGEPLQPAALTTTAGEVSILPQARHAFQAWGRA